MQTYPVKITYAEALHFATHCTVGVEFIEEYGSALSWIDCYIDLGELMVFIESKLRGE